MRKILLSPLFLLSLFILLVNDFFLKSYFHNFLTGKLSDFAGLFAFALFWTAFFPKQKAVIFGGIVAFFTFWKSPYASEFIAVWNIYAPFTIERTVDYTDLAAFVVLPFAWRYADIGEPLRIPKFSRELALTAVTLTSVFAFTATSQPKPESSRSQDYQEVYRIEKAPIEILKKMQDFETDEFNESKGQGRDKITFGLNLKEKYCDNKPYATFEISGHNKASDIKLTYIGYNCEALNQDDREKLKKLFEKDVIEFLKN